MFESTFSRPIGFFRGLRCKRLKMVGLGRLGRLRPTEQRIRSSMFPYASGAGSRDWQSKPLSLAAKRRVCLAGAGRLTRTGPGEESARNIWVGQLPRSGLPGHLAPLRTARVRYGQMKSKRTDQRNEADLRGVMAESFL